MDGGVRLVKETAECSFWLRRTNERRCCCGNWVAGGTVSPTKQVGILRHEVKTDWELNITPVWLAKACRADGSWHRL